MGYVYADVELINASDIVLAKRHVIGEDEIKKISINMLADTGAYLMAINENIQAVLDIPFIEKRKMRMADETIVEYDIVGPVMVKFANRTAICNAYVLPGNSEPLLGAIPLEEMDVLIHPQRQELIVHPDHPDMAVYRG